MNNTTFTMHPLADGSAELEHLHQLLRDNGTVLLASLGGPAGRRFGLFNDFDRLLEAVGTWAHSDLFTNVNRLEPLTVRNEMKRPTSIKDANIVRRTRLFFDFDPVRPGGSNATDAELAASRDVAQQVAAYLAGLGWPEPAIATSGNGTHLLYRCDLAAGTNLRPLYRRLGERFGSAAVDVDLAVSNAARLCRLYGLPNRKSPASPDRPQRMSSIVLPEGWQVVTDDHLGAALAALMPAPSLGRPPAEVRTAPAGNGNYRTLDVEAWAESHGAYLGRADNRVRIRCPWEEDHTMQGGVGDTVIFDNTPDAWPSFHCSHSHCVHRKIRDLMERWGDADRYCAWPYRRVPVPGLHGVLATGVVGCAR